MSSTRIQLYRVKGTHYEWARTIGNLTREAIRQRIADDLEELSHLFTFVQTDDGRQLHQEFIETICLSYPWYWDEILGLADGSQIPLQHLLVLNFLNETKLAYQLIREKKFSNSNTEIGSTENGERGCTTVLLNRTDTNTLSLLHNEDHTSALYKTAFLLEVNIQSSEYDGGKRQSPDEKFLAYCYAGAIPGMAFGVNEHGFAYALNGLYPNYVARRRLPRQIANRALLSIKNEQELDNLCRTNAVAFGFCINGDDYEIVMNYLVHYNHYERLNKLINEQKPLESTFNRYQRGQEIGELFTIDDALNLLGDNKNKAFPIFRQPNKTHNTSTLCTVHINFETLQLCIYECNPKDSNQPSIVYNLKDLFV